METLADLGKYFAEYFKDKVEEIENSNLKLAEWYQQENLIPIDYTFSRKNYPNILDPILALTEVDSHDFNDQFKIQYRNNLKSVMFFEKQRVFLQNFDFEATEIDIDNLIILISKFKEFKDLIEEYDEKVINSCSDDDLIAGYCAPMMAKDVWYATKLENHKLLLSLVYRNYDSAVIAKIQKILKIEVVIQEKFYSNTQKKELKTINLVVAKLKLVQVIKDYWLNYCLKIKDFEQILKFDWELFAYKIDKELDLYKLQHEIDEYNKFKIVKDKKVASETKDRIHLVQVMRASEGYDTDKGFIAFQNMMLAFASDYHIDKVTDIKLPQQYIFLSNSIRRLDKIKKYKSEILSQFKATFADVKKLNKYWVQYKVCVWNELYCEAQLREDIEIIWSSLNGLDFSELTNFLNNADTARENWFQALNNLLSQPSSLKSCWFENHYFYYFELIKNESLLFDFAIHGYSGKHIKLISNFYNLMINQYQALGAKYLNYRDEDTKVKSCTNDYRQFIALNSLLLIFKTKMADLHAGECEFLLKELKMLNDQLDHEYKWLAKFEFIEGFIARNPEVSLILSEIGGINFNGKFDQQKLNKLITNFETVYSSKVDDERYQANYDFNQDGAIDILDFYCIKNFADKQVTYSPFFSLMVLNDSSREAYLNYSDLEKDDLSYSPEETIFIGLCVEECIQQMHVTENLIELIRENQNRFNGRQETREFMRSCQLLEDLYREYELALVKTGVSQLKEDIKSTERLKYELNALKNKLLLLAVGFESDFAENFNLIIAPDRNLAHDTKLINKIKAIFKFEALTASKNTQELINIIITNAASEMNTVSSKIFVDVITYLNFKIERYPKDVIPIKILHTLERFMVLSINHPYEFIFDSDKPEQFQQFQFDFRAEPYFQEVFFNLMQIQMSHINQSLNLVHDTNKIDKLLKDVEIFSEYNPNLRRAQFKTKVNDAEVADLVSILSQEELTVWLKILEENESISLVEQKNFLKYLLEEYDADLLDVYLDIKAHETMMLKLAKLLDLHKTVKNKAEHDYLLVYFDDLINVIVDNRKHFLKKNIQIIYQKSFEQLAVIIDDTQISVEAKKKACENIFTNLQQTIVSNDPLYISGFDTQLIQDHSFLNNIIPAEYLEEFKNLYLAYLKALLEAYEKIKEVLEPNKHEHKTILEQLNLKLLNLKRYLGA